MSASITIGHPAAASRRLGTSGLVVSALGFGCMGLSEFRGAVSGADAEQAIHHAIDRGITHFDTADMYGDGANETLLGRALQAARAESRTDVTVATKCGIVRAGAGFAVNGTPEHIRASCEASLRRLQIERVDLLYLHRVDPRVPVEDSVGAMAALVAQGKVRALGLSKIDAPTLARAESAHPVAAVQMQYSLWDRRVEQELLAACRARDVALVAYSPLGKGLATDRIHAIDALAPDDRRRADSRFHGDGLVASRRHFETLAIHADRHGCTPAQLALAWLLARGEDVIPIPGMRSAAHVDENAGALRIVVAPETLLALDAIGRPVEPALG
jgi:aryl-alcohol dehydrogenase-like predicted oxidoreductase